MQIQFLQRVNDIAEYRNRITIILIKSTKLIISFLYLMESTEQKDKNNIEDIDEGESNKKTECICYHYN